MTAIIKFDFQTYTITFSASPQNFKCTSLLSLSQKEISVTVLWGLSLMISFFQCRNPEFLLSRYTLYQSSQAPGEDTVAPLTQSLGIVEKCWDLHDKPYASV